MICPHCNYKDGWDGETLRNLEGDKGPFYELPVTMVRKERYDPVKQEVELYACPSCKKTFID